MRMAIVLLIALLAPGCRTKPKPAPGVTLTEFHWPGATAEQLFEVVQSVAPGFRVAIIHDERAEVFHEMAAREVDHELGLTAALRPDRNFAISGPTAINGGIPDLPVQVSENRIVIGVETEQLKRLGLTTSEFMTALSQAGIDPDMDPESARKLETAVMTTPAGHQVPMRELTRVREEAQLRPLIIDRR